MAGEVVVHVNTVKEFLQEFDDARKVILYGLCVIVIALVGYVIYHFFIKSRIRLFYFGHTERKFQSWVEKWFANIVALSTEDPIASPLLDTFQAAFPGTFRSAKINLESHPALFIMLIFYDEIKEGRRSVVDNAYDVIKHLKMTNALGLQSVASLYKDPPAYREFSDEAWENLKVVVDAFDVFRRAIGSSAVGSGVPNLLVLNLMLNTYFEGDPNLPNLNNNIKYMYKTRQIGGFANFTLFRVYIKGYVEYVFHQKIKKEIWSSVGKDLLKAMDTVNNALTSPSVMNWFTSLPSRIAGGMSGGESFKEEFLQLVKNPYGKDVQENFIQYLMQIGKTFVAMFDVIMGIVNVINDPLGFIKYLIGIIVAVTLFVTYVVLVAMQVGTLIAVIWIISIKVFQTILWTALFLVFAIIYGILAVIDIPLGGAIMASLRCENPPDAWSTVSNWHRSNHYERSFFCSAQCSNTYYPDGWMCAKQSPDEPVWVPQQVLYNLFLNRQFLQQNRDKWMYSHNPSLEYFTKYTEEKKKALWSQVYAEQLNFFQAVASTPDYRVFDPVVQSICLQFTSEGGKFDDPAVQEKVVTLCQQAYCGGSDMGFSFCENPVIGADLSPQPGPPKQLIHDASWMACMIVVILLAITYVYQSSLLHSTY